MKNFYEITVTDISNLLNVYVELIEHQNPNYNFTVNGRAVSSGDTMTVGLLDQLDFSCIVTQGAVEVAKIAINGKEIMPIYLHLAEPATNWITNCWTFKMYESFYPWYHRITGQGWIA